MQKSNAKIDVLVGIGNPGDEYANTYHNIGMIAVRYWAQKEDARWETPPRKPFSIAKGKSRAYAVTAAYMNESGPAVKTLLEYQSLVPEHIGIVHDDTDMTIGTWKIAHEQNSGGHNGITSIIEALDTNTFWRIKIGVRPRHELIRKKASSLVLKPISKKNLLLLEKVFEEIYSALTADKEKTGVR